MKVTVDYKENYDYGASTSTATITMAQADTSIQIYTNRETTNGIIVRYNEQMILTAKVVDDGGKDIKYGYVQFYNYDTQIGKPSPVNNKGEAYLKFKPKKKGIIKAQYIKNKYYNSSTSSTKAYKMQNINTDINIKANGKTPQQLKDSPEYINKKSLVKLEATVTQQVVKQEEYTSNDNTITREVYEQKPLDRGTITFVSYKNNDTDEGVVIGQAVTVDSNGYATLEYSPMQLYDDPQTTEYIRAIYNYGQKFRYYNSSYDICNITIVKDAKPLISINPVNTYYDNAFSVQYNVVEEKNGGYSTITDSGAGVIKLYIDDKTEPIKTLSITTGTAVSGALSSGNILSLAGNISLGYHTFYITHQGVTYNTSATESNRVTINLLKKFINTTPVINLTKYSSAIVNNPCILEATVDQSEYIGNKMIFYINNGSITQEETINSNRYASYDFRGNPGDYTVYAKVGAKNIENYYAKYVFNEATSQVCNFSILSDVKLNLSPNVSRAEYRGSMNPTVSIENAYNAGNSRLYLNVAGNEVSTSGTELSLPCSGLDPGTYTIRAYTAGGNNYGKGTPMSASATVTIHKQSLPLAGWTSSQQTCDWINAPLWLNVSDKYHEGFTYDGTEQFCFELWNNDNSGPHIKYYNNKAPEYYATSSSTLPSSTTSTEIIDVYMDNGLLYGNLPVNLSAGQYKAKYSFTNSKWYDDFNTNRFYRFDRILRPTKFIMDSECHYPSLISGTDSFKIKLIATANNTTAGSSGYSYDIDIPDAQVLIFLRGDTSRKEIVYLKETGSNGVCGIDITFQPNEVIHARVEYYPNRIYTPSVKYDADKVIGNLTYEETENPRSMQYQYYSGSSWKDSNNGYSGFRR